MSEESKATETVARYYVPELNPFGAFLPGVPLRDLTQAEYDALPAWLQASVDAAPWYAARPPEASDGDQHG